MPVLHIVSNMCFCCYSTVLPPTETLIPNDILSDAYKQFKIFSPDKLGKVKPSYHSHLPAKLGTSKMEVNMHYYHANLHDVF
jgi:hypothetical protein